MSEQPVRTIRIVGMSDLAMFLFLSVCVVTCGWSPRCAPEGATEVAP